MATKSLTNWVILFFVAGSMGGAVYFFSKATSPDTAGIVASTNATNHMASEAAPKSAVIKTNMGDIEVVFNDATPKAVENFVKLSREGFYNGTKFHRVIKGFMIQGGDPLSKDDAQSARWGTGGPGYTFSDEVSSNDRMDQGTLAMANAGPNTNGSQFFIITSTQGTPWLSGKHTPFGRVTKGLSVALEIEKVRTSGSPLDRPVQPVIVESITVN